MDFYEETLTALMRDGQMARTDRILVACGGAYDVSVLRTIGIERAMISNLDERYDCRPYEWSRQDAEALTLPDSTFDWAIVHAGLHHCASPHRALLELCRVARKGVLLIEARDSTLMRVAVRLGFTGDFELEAVALEGGRSGGVRNSAVPNFIYRWTEREVWKTVESAYPHAEHQLRFFYGLTLPTRRLAMRGGATRILAAFLGLGARMMQMLLPGQGNRFAAAIIKTGRFKPWIDASGKHLRDDYALGFDPNRYH